MIPFGEDENIATMNDMDANEVILQFPSPISELSQSCVLGVALTSSGHVEADNVQRMLLDNTREIYILLASVDGIDASKVHSLDFSWVPVNEAAFVGSEKVHQYESIGRNYAWMPEVKIKGKLLIDDIIPVPLREILENERLPAQATIVVGMLTKGSELLLPAGISGQIPYKPYYIYGQSIRTTDTFPDIPGGGSRAAA